MQQAIPRADIGKCSCANCFFMREGKVRDHYIRETGQWMAWHGMICSLRPPTKGANYGLEVDEDWICSRWTNRDTQAQPFTHLCPTSMQEQNPSTSDNGDN